MSFDPGAVDIHFRVGDDGRVTTATVACRRPSAAVLFRGRPVDSLLSLLPLVFALCGKAQGAAIRAALAAARGEAMAPQLQSPIAAEAAGEHLLHLLGEEQRELLARVWRDTQAAGPAAQESARALLGLAGEKFLQMNSTAQLSRWVEGGSPLAQRYQQVADVELPGWQSRALPDLSAAQSLALWPQLDEVFARAPTFAGSPAETGAWARQAQHPLVRALAASPLRARWIARLLEWVAWCYATPLVGRVSSVSMAPGVGRSAVDTARGLLLHQIRVSANYLVDELIIVAPTEWNFHPDGALVGWLQAGVEAEMIPAIVRSLDPCVASRLSRDG